jgi:hypothetical protein
MKKFLILIILALFLLASAPLWSHPRRIDDNRVQYIVKTGNHVQVLAKRVFRRIRGLMIAARRACPIEVLEPEPEPEPEPDTGKDGADGVTEETGEVTK